MSVIAMKAEKPFAAILHDQTGLPGCFIEELLANGGLPNTRWAAELDWKRVGKQIIAILEPCPTSFSSDWQVQPYCCYASTVIFYRSGTCEEMHRVDCPSRMWPNTSFIEREGEFYEVHGGKVIHVFERWHHQWLCFRNSELARHFNGKHDEYCRPCRQMKPILEVIA